MNEVQAMFDQAVLKSHQEPVILYFSAPWCGPCKVFKPVIDRQCGIAMREIYHFNVDESKDLAQSLGVRGVPTAIRFVDGKETNRLVGAQPEKTAGDFVG